jgi:hypothetical protein
VYSLIVTAKMNDVDPQAWLDDLLPWNWCPLNPQTRQAA